MQSNYRLLSSILRGQWLIDRSFAVSQLPLVYSLLSGNNVASEAGKENEEVSHAKVYAIGTVAAENSAGPATHQVKRYNSFNEAPPGAVAIVPITGPIMKYDSCGDPGSVTRGRQIREAADHPNIGAIILDIDTPGGMVDGTATLADIVATSAKPVVAFVNDGMMCSAGYWIGSGASEIIASHKTDTIGSIGVYTTFADMRGYFEEKGIKLEDVYSKFSSEKNSSYRKALEGDLTELVSDLDFIASEFISSVKANRAGKLNLSAGDPFKGASYYAPEALEIGLIDHIGSFEFALQRAQELAKGEGSEQSRNNSSNNSNNMFGKNKGSSFPKLNAVAAKKADEITLEEVGEANAELEASGSGIGVLTESQFDAYEASAANEKTLQAANEKLTSDLSTMTADRDSWKQKAEELGQARATDPKNPVAETPDNIQGGTEKGDAAWNSPELSFNKSADNSRVR